MSDADINTEEFSAGADMAAVPAIAPEPELEVGVNRHLPVQLLAAEAREHFWVPQVHPPGNDARSQQRSTLE